MRPALNSLLSEAMGSGPGDGGKVKRWWLIDWGIKGAIAGRTVGEFPSPLN